MAERLYIWYSACHTNGNGCFSMYNQRKEDPNKVNINHGIRAPELRVMGPHGENLGVLSKKEAVKKAEELGLDLIEVSAKAVPPVAKITDYGKFTYELKKKQREIRAKSHTAETKVAQVKIGTGERDKELKIERIQKWLIEGHRVKVDLFLWGRYKYMEPKFLTERLEKFLNMLLVPYKIADPIKKSPKGFSCTLEKDKSKPTPTKEELATLKEERALEQKKEKKEKKKAQSETTISDEKIETILSNSEKKNTT
jgi:translation initiation factor IF-3